MGPSPGPTHGSSTTGPLFAMAAPHPHGSFAYGVGFSLWSQVKDLEEEVVLLRKLKKNAKAVIKKEKDLRDRFNKMEGDNLDLREKLITVFGLQTKLDNETKRTDEAEKKLSNFAIDLEEFKKDKLSLQADKDQLTKERDSLLSDKKSLEAQTSALDRNS